MKISSAMSVYIQNKAGESLGLLFLVCVVLVGPLGAFLQSDDYDYVPGMEKFPDIDFIQYSLQAEFNSDTTHVKAKAVATFKMKEPSSNFVIFEIDRRARIFWTTDGEENPLKFEQPETADYVKIYLTRPVKKEETVKIVLDYVCRFPPLQVVKSKQQTHEGQREGHYFYLRKWYPINDYFCDLASADFVFTLPRDYEVLTSGYEVSVDFQPDKKISRWKSFGPSNFYFVFAGPFKKYVYSGQTPRVNIYMDTEDRGIANSAKEKAINILRYYGELLRPYPYPVIHLVTTHAETAVCLNGLTHIGYEQFSFWEQYSDWAWSHELAHHWFGGVVSPKEPQDYCLLVEAPAEYWSRLYIQSIKGEEQFGTDLEVQRMIALRGNEVVPITEFYTLKKGADFLYAKGFYVFHMLRYLMGDEKFFSMMRDLVDEFDTKPAGIRDLQQLSEHIYGQPLQWFFDQWVSATGIPEYELFYRIDSKESGKYQVTGNIGQNLENFQMPVEIKAVGRNERSVVKVLVEHQENPFQFEIPFKPDTVVLDPEYRILRWDEGIKVWLYTSRARRLKREKKYEEAKELLDRALVINPYCSWAFFESAHMAYQTEQYEFAVQYCIQALDGDMDFHMIPWSVTQMKQVLFLLQGRSSDILGRRQEAIACYQKAVALGRDRIYPRYYEEAEQYITKPFSKKK